MKWEGWKKWWRAQWGVGWKKREPFQWRWLLPVLLYQLWRNEDIRTAVQSAIAPLAPYLFIALVVAFWLAVVWLALRCLVWLGNLITGWLQAFLDELRGIREALQGTRPTQSNGQFTQQQWEEWAFKTFPWMKGIKDAHERQAEEAEAATNRSPIGFGSKGKS